MFLVIVIVMATCNVCCVVVVLATANGGETANVIEHTVGVKVVLVYEIVWLAL